MDSEEHVMLMQWVGGLSGGGYPGLCYSTLETLGRRSFPLQAGSAIKHLMIQEVD